MNQSLQKVAGWEIPEPAMQSTGSVIAVGSIVFAIGAIIGLFQSDLSGYVVLLASALGVLGPVAYLRHNQKWKLVDMVFGLAMVVCCAYASIDLAPFVFKAMS